MNALRTYLALLAIFALVNLFAACSDGSSVLSANPGECVDDEDEPGDIDENDEEDDDDDDDDDECDDD